MLVSFYVYSFRTQYSEGFLQHEIDELLEFFPRIDEEEFYNVLLDNTCELVNSQVIMRKNDIESALFICLKQVEQN